MTKNTATLARIRAAQANAAGAADTYMDAELAQLKAAKTPVAEAAESDDSVRARFELAVVVAGDLAVAHHADPAEQLVELPDLRAQRRVAQAGERAHDADLGRAIPKIRTV